MLHSHLTCPICINLIQDFTLEECDKCGWVLKTEDSLEPRIYNLLVDWGVRNYEKVKELEGRGKYRQDKLNSRLDSQRDDIDRLKQQILNITTHIPEIKSILLSQEINVDRDIEVPIATATSIEDIDSSLMNTTSGDLTDLDERKPLLPIELNTEPESTLPEREHIKYEVIELSQAQQQIISDYYHNSKEFAPKYQVRIANTTKSSINANRGSEDKLVILEENNRGNYWIFDFDDRTYLVPVEDKYINQHSYTTTSTIFEGHNYTPDYQKIQLIKPAIVSIEPNTNPQTWRLQQQGELVFL